MQTMRPLLAALLVTAALAGCAEDTPGGPGDDLDLDLEHGANTGVIQGVVVDSSVTPVIGADVSVKVGEKTLTTKTIEGGAFGFANVEPNTYFVKVSKPGFRPTQQSVDVLAGVSDPPMLKVQLETDASFVKPYFESYAFKGFIECAAGAISPVVYAVYSACSAPNPVDGQPLFTNDKFAVNYTLAAKPMWVQSEMVWTSTSPAGDQLNLNFYYPCDSATDGLCDLPAFGSSPLILSMDNKTAEEYVGDDLNLRIRVFPWATSDPGVAFAFEQSFDIYTHVFYGYAPPADWTFGTQGDYKPPA